MILASHVIFSAYGFWLPNDPRGSWSDFVGSWELYKFGPATTVDTKRSLAHDPHDRAARLAAKAALKYPPVRFDAAQREAIADGFEIAVNEAEKVLSAVCLPDSSRFRSCIPGTWIMKNSSRLLLKIARNFNLSRSG